jgi:hypothetical protein
MTYGSGVAVCHMTEYGLGRHIYVMDVQNIPLYLRVSRHSSPELLSCRG